MVGKIVNNLSDLAKILASENPDWVHSFAQAPKSRDIWKLRRINRDNRNFRFFATFAVWSVFFALIWTPDRENISIPVAAVALIVALALPIIAVAREAGYGVSKLRYFRKSEHLTKMPRFAWVVEDN